MALTLFCMLRHVQGAVRRIRAEVAGPYEAVRVRSRQLANIHGTVDLLRRTLHRLKLVAKLRQAMAAPAGQVRACAAGAMRPAQRCTGRTTTTTTPLGLGLIIVHLRSTAGTIGKRVGVWVWVSRTHSCGRAAPCASILHVRACSWTWQRPPS